MFANPEDAAEYIDFDLKEVGETSHVREGRREVLRHGQPHPLLGREPRELGEGRRGVRRRAGSSASTPTRGSARPRRTGRSRTSRSTPRSDFEKDMFEDGHVDVAVFQPTYLKEWYTTGFNTAEMDAEMAARHPDKLIVNGRFDPRDGDPGLRQLEEDARAVRPQGREALHGRVERRLARLQARRRRSARRSSRSASSSASRTSTSTRARRSGRWTRTPSTSPTSTRSRPATRSSTSSSSTSACRGSRTSASWRRRSATSTPASRSSSAA